MILTRSIDDDRDMGELSKYLVQTNGKYGLTKKKALEAIGLLGEKILWDSPKKRK